MKNSILLPFAIAAAAMTLAMTAHAQEKADPQHSMQNMLSTATASNMTDGEIRKVDVDNKKITIKHSEIKNLDMPGMTMVFQVKDAAMLDKVKLGEKVRFSAEKIGGAIVVTDIQSAEQP